MLHVLESHYWNFFFFLRKKEDSHHIVFSVLGDNVENNNFPKTYEYKEDLFFFF